MSKHYTNKQLMELVSGNFAVPKAVEFSKHIAQCAVCKNNLEKIAPGFIEQQNDISPNTHFSEMELIAFLKAEIPLQNRLEMSEHLRDCVVCKTKLYAQNPQFMKQTVATYLNKEEVAEKKSFFSSINILVPIGAMAALLISLLFFALPKPKPEVDLSQINVEDNNGIPQVTPNISDDVLPPSSNKSVDLPTQNSKIDLPVINKNITPKTVSKKTVKASDEIKVVLKDEVSIKVNKAKKPDNFNISISRSSNSNCEEEDRVIAISPNFEKITETQPTFRWKKFKNAVKYNIYVSDTAQILLEEAEIMNETSYKLKAQLEQNKPYKWSVVATTDDGKTYPSSPIEFSLGKKARKYKIAKVTNETRCLKKKETK